AAERRRHLLQSSGGGVLALAAVAAIVVAVTTSGNGGKPIGVGDGSAQPVAIPAAKQTNLQAAAREAGCDVRSFPNFGQDHTTDKVTYKSNPPTSGPHNPRPAQDGAYAPANAPEVGQAVHALEHGRVELQWAAGAP